MSARSFLHRVLPAVLVLGLSVGLVVAASMLLSPLQTLAVAACLGMLGAALHRPEIAIYAVLFLLYSNLPAVSVAFHGVPKLIAAAFPLLLLVPLARDLLVRRAPLVLTPTFALLLLLFAVQVAGAAFARDGPSALESTLTFAMEGVLLYLLVTNVVRTKAALRGATWSLIAAGVLMGAVPLFQQATGTFESSYGGLGQVDGLLPTGELAEGGGEQRQARVAGTIGEKNRYAQVMLVLLPLALSRFLAARGWVRRLLALLCTVLITLGFALALSRGGAIGLACMLAAMVALRVVDARKVLLLAVALAVVLAVIPQYWKRLETIGASVRLLEQDSGQVDADGAMRRRVTSMLAATRVFLDHPLIGVGPGMFQSYSQEYGKADALRRIESGRRAHSLFLEMAAENGAVGLSLFLAALAVTMHALARARRSCLSVDPELAELCTAYLLGLVCYLGTGLFLHLSYMRYFYVLLGLCGAAAEIALRASPSVARAVRVPLVAPGATA